MTVHTGKEPGMSRRRVGAIAVVLIAVLVYLAFSKDIPFTHGYRISAYFSNANDVKQRAPVRIAGVNVGKVVAIDKPNSSSKVRVTFELKKSALPIHADATVKVRPRIFLEGNQFVDLNPGSPSAPLLEDGDSIPAEQTAAANQLDELLTSVNRDARRGLTSIFTEIGIALDTVGTPEQNANQDPEVRVLTGGEALNRAMRYGPEGFKGGARVFDALIGENDTDEQDILRGFRDFNQAINDRETQIVPLIADFATTLGAFADDERMLTEATKQFSRINYESEPTLRKLNEMLPHLTKFANDIAPQLDEIPSMVAAAEPWIDQTTQLLSRSELGTTAPLARRSIRDFAAVSHEGLKTLPEMNRLALCWTNVWQPTLMKQVPDGSLSSGVENYKEFWYALVGWAGATQNFTGNGNYLRMASGSASQARLPGNKWLISAQPESGRRPARQSQTPPLRDDVACYKNAVPDLAAAAGSTP
ncbi:MAG: MCE family protein [Actinobacteria bacterium]|nr:MCE family protein [Actinomycetota bacterium]